MDDQNLLTAGSISKLVTGTEDNLCNFTPTVQVLTLRRVEEETEKYVYRLQISDGLRSFTAIKLASSLNVHVDRKEIAENSLIKLNNYSRAKLGDHRFVIVIQKLDIIMKGSEVGKKLGNPQPFSAADVTPWLERHYLHAHRKFNGSGENEPGLSRVKEDITTLQKYLQSLKDRHEQKIPLNISKLIHEIIFEYEQAKFLSCSNYIEIGAKIEEIGKKYHPIFSKHFSNDKVWWQAYSQGHARMIIMFRYAQDYGYNGFGDHVSPSNEDYDKIAEPSDYSIEAMNNLRKRIEAALQHNCTICSKLFGSNTKEDLKQKGMANTYPSSHPTVISVTPKYTFELQIVCSLKCDKIRLTKEAEVLRNDGIRIRKSDLKWNLCQVCYEEKKLKKCGECHMAYYCSKACQEKHWPSHKNKCSELKKLNKTLSAKISHRTSGDINSLEKQMDFNISMGAYGDL